ARDRYPEDVLVVLLTEVPNLVIRHFRAWHFGADFAVAPGQVAVGAPPYSGGAGATRPISAQAGFVALECFLLGGGVFAAVDDTEIGVHESILRVWPGRCMRQRPG